MFHSRFCWLLQLGMVVGIWNMDAEVKNRWAMAQPPDPAVPKVSEPRRQPADQATHTASTLPFNQDGALSAIGSGPLAAKDWQVIQGSWHFEPGGELVCAGKTFSSLIFLKQRQYQDLEVSVEVMFLGPQSSAGIIFRSTGRHFYRDMTFYQFEWYTEGRHHGKRLSLMIKNPRWKQIVTPVLRPAPYHQWIRFRVRARGPELEAFIDDVRVFTKHDATFLRSGNLGLHVFQPRGVRFRAFGLKKL